MRVHYGAHGAATDRLADGGRCRPAAPPHSGRHGEHFGRYSSQRQCKHRRRPRGSTGRAGVAAQPLVFQAESPGLLDLPRGQHRGAPYSALRLQRFDERGARLLRGGLGGSPPGDLRLGPGTKVFGVRPGVHRHGDQTRLRPVSKAHLRRLLHAVWPEHPARGDAYHVLVGVASDDGEVGRPSSSVHLGQRLVLCLQDIGVGCIFALGASST
mmetsp:Transcript_124994/g.400461  ORF Transcript_124994/g.400461 Transcript_124994/m.400461 type:complete len:212 (-) Transcript_124994:844-1479(-)